MARKRILLTGAAGRVGKLIRPLLQERYALRLSDLTPVPAAQEDDEVLTGDLSDPAVAREAIRGVAGVVHLAGLVAPAVSFEDTLAPNYRAVLCLLEACRQGGVNRFVFASSHHALGLHAAGPLDAGAPLAPDGFYGLSKAFGEAACALYARRFGIRTLIVRIGNADPEVADGRRERLWVSARDLAQLLAIGLEHDAIGCEMVYGVSRCPNAFFADATARRLGYRPLDTATAHHSADFRPLATMGTSDGAAFIGGTFAMVELPPPFVRTRSD